MFLPSTTIQGPDLTSNLRLSLTCLSNVIMVSVVVVVVDAFLTPQ